MKKLAALLLAATMCVSVTACGSSTKEDTSAADNTTAEDTAEEESASDSAASDKVFNIGICQLVQHEALDAATKGFEDALVEEFGEDGVKFDEQNAQGDSATCATIANGFVSAGVDLIMANATPALQAAQSATNEIPVLGTSVTEYGVALGLSDFSGTVGGNISGTSDLADLAAQANMITEWFPDATKVGLLFCSAEPNSVFQVETIQGYLEEMGYTCTQYAFTDVNDLSAVTQSACDGSDVIYIPTDNTAANNTETIANVVIPAGVPVVCGESGICSGCGVATLSISYEELGRITGEMAVQILTGEADVSELAIQYDTAVTKMYNAANCEALGITVPDGYQPIE